MEYESTSVTHSAAPLDTPDSGAAVADAPLDDEGEEESGSGSGGSVEYSRTQRTETEEIIETEVCDDVSLLPYQMIKCSVWITSRTVAITKLSIIPRNIHVLLDDNFNVFSPRIETYT